ncbi:ParA family protein [Sinorhizobium chiapasense]
MAKRQRAVNSGIPVTREQAELFDKVRSLGSRATCFFNNKGGVGKTTLVANLGAELAMNFGAKVLVVDCVELPPKDRTCSGLRLRADELAG